MCRINHSEINHFGQSPWFRDASTEAAKNMGGRTPFFALDQRKVPAAGLSLSVGSRAPAVRTAERGCGSGSSPDYLSRKARVHRGPACPDEIASKTDIGPADTKS